MSQYQEALEKTVRPRLESTFGKAVAMLVVASASNAVNAPMVGISKEQYEGLCEAICKDQRVIDMWGTSGAQDALSQWRAAGG